MATQFNIFLGNKVSTVSSEPIILDLQGTNGVFILGRPGNGKSHLIAYLLTQLVYRGSKLLVSEYNAHNGAEGQTLLERIDHLQGAYIQPAKTHGKDIVAVINWVKEELIRRQNGADKYPLVVVFDEFFQFASSYKPEKTVNRKVKGDARTDEGEFTTKQESPTYWNDINTILTDARKNNIRVIIAVQESAGTGTSNMMRTVRDLFGIKLLMQSSETNAELLGVSDKKHRQVIDRLPKGIVYFNGGLAKIPYPIPQEYITGAINKAATMPKVIAPVAKAEKPKAYEWTDEDEKLFIAALLEYGPKINMWTIDTKEDLIRTLVKIGKNNLFIKSTIKGKAEELDRIANSFRKEQ